MIYPADAATLDDLAYSFQYAHADDRDPDTYVMPLRRAIDEWRTASRTSYRALRYRRGPGGLLVRDGRPHSDRANYTLGEREAAIYLAWSSLKAVAIWLSRCHGGCPKRHSPAMSQLSSKDRKKLPKSAFAYVNSRGRRRLPIHDESHVRNALARFTKVAFEDEAARERARKKLLGAAKKYGIVPIGFMTGQLEAQMSAATAGRLVIELGRVDTPSEFERRLRVALRDPTLSVLRWSDSDGTYLDGAGRPATLPPDGEGRAVTLLERHGQPMTALVHDRAVLDNPDLVKTVTAAVKLAVENERLRGQVEAQASEARTLPTGHVTFLLSDIEGSTNLLQRLGDRYATLLADVRALIRLSVGRVGGREVDAR